MCGIAGFFYTDSNQIAEKEIITKMTDTLKHRGPDSEGYYVDNNLALGHRRLSIIDLSAVANQPLCNEDRTVWTVFNGEIYNFKELRNDLISKGHKFKTNSDTEVIVHGYEEWKTDCFQHFCGMMACAIYDKNNRELILAKDRFGKKPLYYTLQNGIFAFASEIKALQKHPDIDFVLNKDSVLRYLVYDYVPTPASIYEDVFKLGAAQYLIISTEFSELKDSGVKLIPKTYWRLEFEPKWECSLEEGERKFRDLFVKSVEKRLVSDVPLGVFLSGGIDSSAVTWAMAQIMDAAKIDTFSIGFEEKSFDESSYAEQVANYFGTRHHEKVFDTNALLDTLPIVVEMLDEPFADASILPTYLLSKFTREFVTVALGGDGGDELFAGYDPFVALKIARYFEKIPQPIIDLSCWCVDKFPISDKNMSLQFRAHHFLKGFYPELKKKPELRNQVWLGAFSHRDMPFNGKELPALEIVYNPTLSNVDESLSDIDRLSNSYISTYMHDDILVKIDRASMMNSLEVRSPFLDTELAEFVARLPVNFKMRGLRTKYLLKNAMKGLLPNFVLERYKKGFGIPNSQWLRKELAVQTKNELGALTDQLPGYFSKNLLEKLYSDHLASRADYRKEIWNMSMLGAIAFNKMLI